jgi:hypothetical protein
MKPTDEQRREFGEKAQRVYREHLQTDLERDHLGKVLALDPESGEHAVGLTFGLASTAFRDQFGTRPAYYLQIGGGNFLRSGRPVHGRAS